MKLFALAFVFMFANAFAEVPEITASQMTCDQLKENLKNYGSIIVVKKVLLFKKRVLIHQSVDCSSDETKNYGSFKTIGERHCSAGQWCKADPVYSSGDYSGDYSSGSSYDYGSSYDSGSSSSGPNYNPPSSSYEGPSYNPPSSSSQGSNYNPPSSGTRGSRYCPGC